MKKQKQVIVGSVVAFNRLPDAIWFDVIEVDGFTLTVREFGEPNYIEQKIDKSLVKQIR